VQLFYLFVYYISDFLRFIILLPIAVEHVKEHERKELSDLRAMYNTACEERDQARQQSAQLQLSLTSVQEQRDQAFQQSAQLQLSLTSVQAQVSRTKDYVVCIPLYCTIM